ncbi:MAG TPA: 23S rRNA (adenine(2503)-C(2))-methyltransferase RlmN [Thermomicrobiales bacterium]|nr:23S rRNA (adenine(2503)-C(2))-methyltransferase RlmN [Thermomicrobiales bacterium]
MAQPTAGDAESIVASPRYTRLPRHDRPVALYDMSVAELTERCRELGQPAYRARQLFDWAYRHLVSDYGAMTNLPTAFRAELETALPLGTMAPVRDVEADGGDTIKTLYRTFDGQLVETVLMLYADRATVCVSCQVGCAVGCAFCATGLGGLTRNLSAGEMVAQVVGAARQARERGRKLTNLVMMGMGEPLQTYQPTMKLVEILHEPIGFDFGARRITISTSGVVPKIDALAGEPYQVNLAVSLHAPNDELRDRLVPLNRRYPIGELLDACERYVAKTGRRVSFEYALMAGINDSDETAGALARLLRRRRQLRCHVNVIPLNPVDVLPYERPSAEGIERFAAILRDGGIATTIRYSRGVDIAAACGQLRAREAASPSASSLGARHAERIRATGQP